MKNHINAGRISLMPLMSLLCLLWVASQFFMSVASAASSDATATFTLVPLPQTGQTICYNEAGAVITCANSGQDGELQSGLVWPIPRFVDNGDQTQTDKLTGLIWSKNANPAAGTKTWQEGLDYIKTLNSGNYLGHNDWRLPNINELKSLVNQGQASPATWLNSQGFTSAQDGSYWSSSSNAHITYGAWYVNMDHGFMDGSAKMYSNSVWPVRSGQLDSLSLLKTGQTACYNTSGTTITCSGTGQDGELQIGTSWPAARFIANVDQTMTDGATGLVWSENANPAAAKTWQQALDYIKSLNSSKYLGYSDWRLPNSNELASLVSRGEGDSAAWLNGQGFTSVQSSCYWSSSSNAFSTNVAWYVNMNYGYMNVSNKSNSCSVWPVRSGQYWYFDTLILSATQQFGTTPTGTMQPAQQITIGNRGVSSQSITTLMLSGAHAAEFSISSGGNNPCGTVTPTLAPGASCTLMLALTPVSSGVKSASLDVYANGITKNIALSATGISTVYGVVTDSSTGLPVSGATVTLSTSATTTTGTDGSYSFSDLAAASYSLTISKTGYQTVSKSGATVGATTSAKTDILLPTVGTLNITTSLLPWALPNVQYSNRVMVTGGTAPYKFTRPYGTLPTGFVMDTATGIISGTPSGTGSYVFAIGVTDNVIGYSEKEFTIDLVSPLSVVRLGLCR